MNTARLALRGVRSAALRTLAFLRPAPVRHSPAAPSVTPPQPRPADIGTPRLLPGLDEEWLNGDDVALVRPYVQLNPRESP